MLDHCNCQPDSNWYTPSRPLSWTHQNFHSHYYVVHRNSLRAHSHCRGTLELPPHLITVTISYLILLIMPSLPFDKLNKTNYDDWKIQMEALLEEKGLFGVVSGRDILPTTGPNSKGVKTFLEKQHLARSKIILTIEPSQLPHVRNEENPFVIWKNLAQIHRARGLGVLLTMHMDFLKMSMPPGSTIAAFVASIHHAAYCLEECYQAEEDDSLSISINSSISLFIPPTTRPPIVSDLDKISVLMNGLPSTYNLLLLTSPAFPSPLSLLRMLSPVS